MSGSFPAEKQLAAQMQIPAEIAALMQRLEREGFAVYAVGGCVRDTLLGKKPCDWDLATNAGLDHLKEIFPEGRTLSSKFCVIRVTAAAADGRTDVDIAAFRREESYENGRPAVFSFVDSIEEDLPRRDFTINAMAAGRTRFIDLFAGSADLQKKLIRTVGQAERRFSEDPLRMLRAVRLACELDFELDGEIVQAIASCRGLLPLAAPGKVRDELTRLLSAAACKCCSIWSWQARCCKQKAACGLADAKRAGCGLSAKISSARRRFLPEDWDFSSPVCTKSGRWRRSQNWNSMTLPPAA